MKLNIGLVGYGEVGKTFAQKQDWVAQLAASGVFEGVSAQDPWQDYADRLLAALPKAQP